VGRHWDDAHCARGSGGAGSGGFAHHVRWLSSQLNPVASKSAITGRRLQRKRSQPGKGHAASGGRRGPPQGPAAGAGRG
jgi:hypothetical protein